MELTNLKDLREGDLLTASWGRRAQPTDSDSLDHIKIKILTISEQTDDWCEFTAYSFNSYSFKIANDEHKTVEKTKVEIMRVSYDRFVPVGTRKLSLATLAWVGLVDINDSSQPIYFQHVRREPLISIGDFNTSLSQQKFIHFTYDGDDGRVWGRYSGLVKARLAAIQDNRFVVKTLTGELKLFDRLGGRDYSGLYERDLVFKFYGDARKYGLMADIYSVAQPARFLGTVSGIHDLETF